MDLQDLAPPDRVRRLHGDSAIETSRTQESRIEHLRAVGRRDHDHPDRGIEPVHLGEDLIERLLALVVAAAEAADCARSRTADRIQFVDEDDRGRRRLGLLKEVAHARGTHPDEHLHELGGRDREERHLRLAGQRPGQKRLAGARWPGQQHPARDPSSQPPVLVGVAEEVDDLGQFLLGLVDAGHVLEVDVLIRRLHPLRPGAAERGHPAADAAAASHQPHEQPHEQQHRAEGEQQGEERRGPARRGTGVDHHPLGLQQSGQRVAVGELRNLGHELARRARRRVRILHLVAELAPDGRALGGDPSLRFRS